MVKRKWFDTEQEAIVFSEVTDNILDVSYKHYGTVNGEKLKKWAVEYDMPTFNTLYPAMPIEL